MRGAPAHAGLRRARRGGPHALARVRGEGKRARGGAEIPSKNYALGYLVNPPSATTSTTPYLSLARLKGAEDGGNEMVTREYPKILLTPQSW